MQYKSRELDRDTAALVQELEPVINGLGFALVEASLFRRRGKGAGSAQIRLVVNGQAGGGAAGIGTAELSRIHRAVLPRLELALEGRDLYLEVSSPGTDRIIREGAEFRHYTGRAVKCWLTGTDEWERGVLRGSDGEKILLDAGGEIKQVMYETIAKARLDAD
ncbi:MAG: ribosome assembly cofactor RimP [Spirochaetaceae bacterium]|jgi:ribosome maturation factor RimP|nr:ribosome assembly cofactor RimP [Spirochaetaceae bacterium]